MEGLERIIGEINSQAERDAKAIIAEAEKEAAEIIKNAEADAEHDIKAAEADAEKRAVRIRQSAESFSELDKSSRILSAKREAIDNAFDKALRDLKNSPADEYFSMVKRLIVKYAEKGEGTLVFNSADLLRVSPGFEIVVNDALPDDKSIRLSETADDSIDCGAKIIYGNIEINCDFSALVNESRETATLGVANILFGEEN